MSEGLPSSTPTQLVSVSRQTQVTVVSLSRWAQGMATRLFSSRSLRRSTLNKKHSGAELSFGVA